MSRVLVQSTVYFSLEDRLWKFLGSVKLMIGIVSFLAITSIVGTLIIQQPQASKPIAEIYSVETLHWLQFFGLIDLYHSPWFVGLLGAFALNLIIGTIQIWPRNKKIMEQTPHPMRPNEMDQFKHRYEFKVSSKDIRFLKKTFLEKMSDRFYRAQVLEESSNGFQLYVQKGRLSKLIVFFIHTSLMVIIVGSAIGSMFGFEGRLNLGEGELANYYFQGTDLVRRPLPFAIRCDQFSIDYYPGTDQPKAYRSDLKIIQEGDVVSKKVINVNDPLKFHGMNIYQASYGQSDAPTFRLKIIDRKTKREQRVDMQVMKPQKLKNENIVLNVLNYTPRFEDFGPALKLGIKEQNGKPFPALILKNYPGFDTFHRKGRYTYVLDSIDEKYYTGLQIASNPGIVIILVGAGMLIFGLFLSVFWSFRKIWVRLEDNRVTVVGKSTKYPLNFESQMQKLVQQLIIGDQKA